MEWIFGFCYCVSHTKRIWSLAMISRDLVRTTVFLKQQWRLIVNLFLNRSGEKKCLIMKKFVNLYYIVLVVIVEWTICCIHSCGHKTSLLCLLQCQMEILSSRRYHRLEPQQKKQMCQYKKDNPKISIYDITEHFSRLWNVELVPVTVWRTLKECDRWLSYNYKDRIKN